MLGTPENTVRPQQGYLLNPTERGSRLSEKGSRISKEEEMLTVRSMTAKDIPLVVTHVMQYHSTTPYGKLPFVPAKVHGLLIAGLTLPNECYFLVFQDGELVGGIAGSLIEYAFNHEKYAQDHLFYVIPEHRSLFVAQALVLAYMTWAISKQARQINLQTFSGHKTALFGKYVERFGFKPLGVTHIKEV